jgi:hypothetical protein
MTRKERDKEEMMSIRASIRTKGGRPISNVSTMFSTLGTVLEEGDYRCSLCFEPQPDFCIPCGCYYHVECLEQNFSTMIDEGNIPFKCPEMPSEHPEDNEFLDKNNDYFLTEKECHALFNPVYVERYIAHLLKKGMDVAGIRSCPETDCNFKFWV